MARVGRMNKWVTLRHGPHDTTSGGYTDLDPKGVWAQIEPLNPGLSDGDRSQAHRVTIRYHAQVTLDTLIRYGTRDLMVKGVQNVNEDNHTMVLFCEEVIP